MYWMEFLDEEREALASDLSQLGSITDNLIDVLNEIHRYSRALDTQLQELAAFLASTADV